MLGGNQAASGGRIETFYRGSSGFLALGDHLGHHIAWNFFQHHIARKFRDICESNAGDMCVEGLRNGDGKIASRIARIWCSRLTIMSLIIEMLR